MPRGEAYSTGGAFARWDPGSRLVEVELGPQSTLDPATAARLTATISAWVGATESFGILIDVGGAAGTTPMWRVTIGRFLFAHRDRMRLALVKASPARRAEADMYRVIVGIDIRIFQGAEEARAWLLGTAPDAGRSAGI